MQKIQNNKVMFNWVQSPIPNNILRFELFNINIKIFLLKIIENIFN